MASTSTEPGEPRQRLRAREKGGAETGSNPTDCGKPGTKRHLVVDQNGTPVGLCLSPANRRDSLMPATTLDAMPGVRHGRDSPKKLHADKAYDHRRCRKECRARPIAPRIA